MDFKPLTAYIIDYGTVSKLATFTHTEKGINYFFDKEGIFALSDEFISSGKVTVQVMEDDFFE